MRTRIVLHETYYDVLESYDEIFKKLSYIDDFIELTRRDGSKILINCSAIQVVFPLRRRA